MRPDRTIRTLPVRVLGRCLARGLWSRHQALPAATALVALAGALAPFAPVEAVAAPVGRPSLTLSPANGPPGTTITLHGYVPGLAKAPPPYAGVTVCLGSCALGFTEQSLAVRFVGNGRFTTRFTLPKTPVLTARGPLSLVNGRYRVGFTCLGPDQEGCDNATLASATFTVAHSAMPKCTAAHACAGLTLDPAKAAPGELVSVSGFAPLAPMLGAGQPFGYNLVLARGAQSAGAAQLGSVAQSASGRITATFRLPQLAAGLGNVVAGHDRVVLQYQWNAAPTTLPPLPAGVSIERRGKTVARAGGNETFGYELIDQASTALAVTPLTSWGALGARQPDATQWSQPLPLTARAGSQRELAYCGAGGIHLTMNGGRSFKRVRTEGAAKASMASRFPISFNGHDPTPAVTCRSLVWDPNNPHTFYAAFSALNRKYGSMPPVYSVVYETRDGGRVWRPVPTPPGYTQADFGGMQVVRQGGRYEVEVVFGRSSDERGLATTSARVELSSDGGVSWRTAPLACPSEGPCVRFGAMPGMLPGMGTADVEPLVRSTNGGRTWQTLAWPSGNLEAQGMVPTGQSELASLGAKTIAYLDPNSQYALRISHDGGATWQVVALPLPPGVTQDTLGRTGASPYAALMLLSNGDLLGAISPAQGSLSGDADWYVLRPGASSWTADRAIRAPDILGRLVVVGHTLDGLTLTGAGNYSFAGIAVSPAPA